MQAAEITVALVFVDISVHVSNAGVLVAAGVAFLALATTARGPLGIVRICRQRLHLTLTIAVAVTVALAPLIPGLRPDLEGIIVLEFGAIGLIRVATLTQSTDSHAGVPAARRRGSMVIDTTATVVGSDARGGATPGGAPAGSRSQGQPSTSATARWAGRAAAAAASSGKQAAAKYRPEAEARVQKTIRGAGRAAGRLTTWLAPPEDRD